MKPLTVEWVEKAEADYMTAQREVAVTSSPNYDAVCFHAQQSAEKYLKALLQEAEIRFGRTHDLFALARWLEPVHREFLDMEDELRDLTYNAMEIRYLSATGDRALAEEAFGHCARVRERARELLALPPQRT